MEGLKACATEAEVSKDLPTKARCPLGPAVDLGVEQRRGVAVRSDIRTHSVSRETG
jgi:hypothetical protein